MKHLSGEREEWWYVYILRCNNGQLYTGCTSDLSDRLRRHHSGKVDATCDKLPVSLLGFTAFLERHKAFAYERYLKSGYGRAFKLKRLI